MTHTPKNNNVAKPQAIPNIINSLLFNIYSSALLANILVQKTIVKGLDNVNTNA